nr:hypothetical protein [uncultured Amphritea sp.]
MIDFFTALIPIALAALGSYIAIQQYRTNRQKLKIELFEKRYAIYDAVREYMGAIIRKRHSNENEQQQFLVETKGAAFLFDDEIIKFIEDVWQNSIDMGEWHEDELPSTHAQEEADDMRWFLAEFGKLNERFSKYMRLPS